MAAAVTPEKKTERTKAREAFFLEFASAIRREFPGTPLMVTGGFRSRKGMQSAIDEGDCDLIGLGRPAVLDPSLPQSTILNRHVKDDDATLYARSISTPPIARMLGLKSLAGSVGAGAEIVSSPAALWSMKKPGC